MRARGRLKLIGLRDHRPFKGAALLLVAGCPLDMNFDELLFGCQRVTGKVHGLTRADGLWQHLLV